MSEIKKGLEGVVVDQSAVSKVMPETNSLVYRGYPVEELAEKCRFEEVAYLLWNSELPTKSQLENFEKEERELRSLTKECIDLVKSFQNHAHPMDTLRTVVSYLGTEDERIWDDDPKTNAHKALGLLARIPTAIAATFRAQKGKDPIEPKKDLRIAENFLYMCFGEVPDEATVKAFEVSLILYAEHGFNASTFTTRVITSTTSDMYSAVVGGIGALKGPLHGGANEMVMYMLQEIGDPAKAADWLKDALSQKKKVMGFGHRVYRNGDSRVPTMKKYAKKLSEAKGDDKWMAISEELEKTMLAEKNIYPNVDFPAGPAYYLMGLDINLFTPIFVMARVTGWTAHIMEQAGNNRIIRPLCEYTGPQQLEFKPIDQRG
jgi:2-methylcitrate synthase